MYETAEADLLDRPPRSVKRDHLVNGKLLLHAYGFVGILEVCYFHLLPSVWEKQVAIANETCKH